jgi:hypothetical protein
MSEAEARRDAALRQQVLAQGLAESAQQEVVRSALAADNQEKVASQSNTLGTVFAATALAMFVLAEFLRRRRSEAEAKREDGWKAGLTRSIEDIADRVDEMGHKLNAPPLPRRRCRFGRRTAAAPSPEANVWVRRRIPRLTSCKNTGRFSGIGRMSLDGPLRSNIAGRGTKHLNAP